MSRRPGVGHQRRHGFRGIGAPTPIAPASTVAPVASGTSLIDSALSCTTGTWSGTTPITYTYQWERDGTPIGGETTSSHTVVAADVGASITCDVTATNAAGSATQASNALAFDPATLTGTFFLGDASQVAKVGSDVDVLEDQVATGTPAGDQDLTAPAAGQRPAFSAADARLNGQDCLDFVSATSDALQAATASDWNALHDGTGGSFALVLSRDNHSTSMGYISTSGAQGMDLWSTNAASVRWRVFSASVAIVDSGNVAMATATPHVIISRYQESRAPSEADFRIDGAEVFAGDSTGAPSASDAARVLQVGRLFAGTWPFDGAIGHVQVASATWSSAEVATLEAYLAWKFGATLP